MIDVKYFPNKETTSGFIGGGYLTTNNMVKINFRVRDGQYGIWVLLPSQKKPNSNEYVELVQFVNKEAKETITAKVKEAIDAYVAPPTSQNATSQGSENSTQTAPVRRNPAAEKPADTSGDFKLPWE